MKINGHLVPTPSKLSITYSDIDSNSYRNAKGQIIRDRIATKTKLTMEWPPLTDGNIAQLLEAVSNVFFDVEYFDAWEGGNVTKTFYVGDRTAPVLSYNNNIIRTWSGLTMNFIER